MKKLILTFKGMDSWDRPVYENEGDLFVDVDPSENSRPSICTKCNNDFDGEPDEHIAYLEKYKDVELEFVPSRVIW